MTARTFRSMSFGAAVGAQSLGKPASTFPGAIATDADLTIAVNRLQTRLSATLNAVATTMTVADASLIIADTQLSIDGEIVRATADPTGQTVPIARGFDGTTPALHLSGATVSGYVNAWHHNKLVAEVEAIENALGANLSRIPASPLYISTAYEFTPQAPGGSLIVGANTITLSPVPPGVNATDQNHWLYISGGAGTAEAAKIIGGTAIAGAASGTLIIQCANTHSGAWTIQTATAGIQEAIVAIGPTTGNYIIQGTGGGTVYIPPARHDIYTPVMVPSGVMLQGASMNGCILVSHGTTVIQTIPNTSGAGVQNISIDLNVQSNISGIEIRGSALGTYRNIWIFNGASTTNSIGIYLHSILSPDPNNIIHNAIHNLLDSIHMEWGPDRSLVFRGEGAPGDCATTLNVVRNCRLSGSAGPLIDLNQNADTNYFYDIDLNSATASIGIEFNSGNPANPGGIGGYFLRNLIFEGSSTGTAIALNNCDHIYIENVWNGWTNPVLMTPNATAVQFTNLYGFQVIGEPIAHFSTDGFVIGSPFSQLGSFIAFSRAAPILANGANQNVGLNGGSYVFISGPTAAFSVGGFAGGRDGRLLYLFNGTTMQMTIKNQDPGSAATARILTLTGADVVLRAGRSFATFIYDSINQAWILMSSN